MSAVFSRRVFTAAFSATALGVATMNRASAEATPSSSPAASPAGGGFSFTDDKGVTVTLDKMPTTLAMDVNAAASLWDFGIKPAVLFGWNATDDGKLGDAGDNIDTTGVPMAGNMSEPIRPENVAAVKPDLIITQTFSPGDPKEYWSIPEKLMDQVKPIAPIIALSATGDAQANVARYAELATALGADINTDDVKKAKDAFDAGLVELDALTKEKSDISLLYLYVGSEGTWVANPGDWAALSMFQNHHANLVKPEAKEGSYWEELSQEQALKYPSDALCLSTRPGMMSNDELKAHPVWGAHPAVKAGQMYPWNQDTRFSYQGMDRSVRQLIDAYTQANNVVD